MKSSFVVVLLILSVFGLGLGVLITFTSAFGSVRSMAEAATLASIPFIIGTVALSGATIAIAVDDAHREHAELLKRIAVANEKGNV